MAAPGIDQQGADRRDERVGEEGAPQRRQPRQQHRAGYVHIEQHAGRAHRAPGVGVQHLIVADAVRRDDDALAQIMAGRVMNDIIHPIVQDALKLQPPFNVICQTPNMILMPISGSFAVNKDGETNAALRQLFIILLLGLALDCSVDVVRAGDPILFGGGEGIARVPPVPALRELVGLEWIMLDQAPVWLSAIGAAALLASDTAYPERSNIYQILTASTPGHILRRIEQKSGGSVSSRQIKLINQVKEVLHA